MTLLETQVVVIQDDVTEVEERVELLEGDVNFLFDETVIQDERIFTWNKHLLRQTKMLKVSSIKDSR